MRQKLLSFYHKYRSLFLLAVLLLWVKTYISYHIDFDLGVRGWFEHLILLINPVAGTVFFLSLSLFSKNVKRGHRILFAIYLFHSMLLYANIVYYREFTDFLTLSTMMEAKSIFVGSENFISGAISLMKWYDFLYWVDLPCLFILMKRRSSALVLADERLLSGKPVGGKALAWALILFLVNLGLAEISRPMLLTQTFDRNDIVKHLGINAFTVYDSIQTVKHKNASHTPEMDDVKLVSAYASKQYAAPDKKMFGLAEGRNLIIIHMESIQQFLIDYHYMDVNGTEWEVLPFLNELYHSKDSIRFSNLFTQIGQGKSSDAELMTETSLFGLPRGAAFIRNVDNTYYAGPHILREKAGYTSAVFHGNAGSFWNRTDMYKGLGYDFFFDADDFMLTEENSTEYGLKDKEFFQQSMEYLEQLQQPFYAKLITLSNHFPFPYDESSQPFPQADTADESVNGYFAASNYADQALQEFFSYLKESGIYENSMIVLYGDHYGISDSRNKDLAPLLGRDPDSWSELDNIQMRRVPFIIHIPGCSIGFESSVYAGQIDILPTVLHLLGIDTKDQVFLGQDLLSPQRKQVVAFRNGDMISPSCAVIGEQIYDLNTGETIDENNEFKHKLADYYHETALEQLTVSDVILNTNLLQSCGPKDLAPVDRESFDYSIDPARLKQMAAKDQEKKARP
ncbi:MAG TPA: LTA synthase family protein [Clostridiales bacterium]|nr:LTA synthase family protein [Clostridiales bacterium]